MQTKAQTIYFSFLHSDETQPYANNELHEKLKSKIRFKTRWRGNVALRSRDSTTLSIYNVFRQCTVHTTKVQPFTSMRSLRDGRVLFLSKQKPQLYIVDIEAGTTKPLCESIEYDPVRVSLKGVLSVLHLQNNDFVYVSEIYGASSFLMLISNGQEVRRQLTGRTTAIEQLENGLIVRGSDTGITIYDTDLTNPKTLEYKSTGGPRDLFEIGVDRVVLSFGSSYKILNITEYTATELTSTQPAYTTFTKIASDKFIKFNFYEGHQVFDLETACLITTIPARVSDTCTVVESGEYLTFHSNIYTEIKLYNINQEIVERTYFIAKHEMILGIVLD